MLYYNPDASSTAVLDSTSTVTSETYGFEQRGTLSQGEVTSD